jgi:hypothetical protein
MQLNLFEDNRPGILLNIADEFILARDLVQAVSVSFSPMNRLSIIYVA